MDDRWCSSWGMLSHIISFPQIIPTEVRLSRSSFVSTPDHHQKLSQLSSRDVQILPISRLNWVNVFLNHVHVEDTWPIVKRCRKKELTCQLLQWPLWYIYIRVKNSLREEWRHDDEADIHGENGKHLWQLVPLDWRSDTWETTLMFILFFFASAAENNEGYGLSWFPPPFSTWGVNYSKYHLNRSEKYSKKITDGNKRGDS